MRRRGGEDTEGVTDVGREDGDGGGTWVEL